MEDPQRSIGSHGSDHDPAAVWMLQAREGGWLVLARGHGWLHDDRRSALADAQWLSNNFGLPVRETAA
jgi:hypothetical protein